MRRFATMILLVLALVLNLSGAAFASSGKISGGYWFTGDITLSDNEDLTLAVHGNAYTVSGEFYIAPKVTLEVFYATPGQSALKVSDGSVSAYPTDSYGDASLLLATGKYTVYEDSRIALSPSVDYYYQSWECWGPYEGDDILAKTSGFVLGGEAAFGLQDSLSATLALAYSPFLTTVFSESSTQYKSTLLGFSAQASYWVTNSISIDAGYRYFAVTIEDTASGDSLETLASGLFLGASFCF